MTSTRFRISIALIPIACSLVALDASAQGSEQVAEPGATPACSYSACALTIAPRWNGLAVVQGTNAHAVANLNFFWPRDVSDALGGTTSPADQRARETVAGAVRLRRIGAAFTDGGIVLLATAAVRAVSAGHVRQSDAVMAGIGAGAFGVSVPFQFAADGMLSRAVWWHNARYAR